MKKIYFFREKNAITEYTEALIKKILSNYVEFVDNINNCDYVFYSILDITELGKLMKLKNQTNKKIITGGMISEIPIINEISDFVWHGEIYKLAEELKINKDFNDMENMTTKNKKTLIINQKILWNKNPVVCVGNKSAYYYVSKGCPLKCKYCYMSYIRDYQKIDEPLYRKVEGLIKKPKQMMPIGAYNPYKIKTKRNISETLLKEYIKIDKIESSLIRCGVEFTKEEYSKKIAKGVIIDDLNKALEKSKENGQKMILYFIAGLETTEEIISYFNEIKTDYNTTPAVTLVFTYLDPQPFTPLYDWDIRQKKIIDTKKIFSFIQQKNKRIRILPIATPKKSLLRTLYSRIENIEDYKTIKSIENDEYENIITNNKIDHLFGNKNINDIIDRKREKTTTFIKYWK